MNLLEIVIRSPVSILGSCHFDITTTIQLSTVTLHTDPCDDVRESGMLNAVSGRGNIKDRKEPMVSHVIFRSKYFNWRIYFLRKRSWSHIIATAETTQDLFRL